MRRLCSQSIIFRKNIQFFILIMPINHHNIALLIINNLYYSKQSQSHSLNFYLQSIMLLYLIQQPIFSSKINFNITFVKFINANQRKICKQSSQMLIQINHTKLSRWVDAFLEALMICSSQRAMYFLMRFIQYYSDFDKTRLLSKLFKSLCNFYNLVLSKCNNSLYLSLFPTEYRCSLKSLSLKFILSVMFVDIIRECLFNFKIGSPQAIQQQLPINFKQYFRIDNIILNFHHIYYYHWTFIINIYEKQLIYYSIKLYFMHFVFFFNNINTLLQSKIQFDINSMKKNNSSLNLSIKGNSSLSLKANGTISTVIGVKKVNGVDQTNKSFTKKVQNLKGRVVQETLEEQYVNGLQDQIKYLQLQLKLLKQKQADKQGQFDQLEKFFGDGIPINENILAIKNGFNNYQKDNQKKIQEVAKEKKQRETLIEELRERTDEMGQEIKFREMELRKYDQVESDRNNQLLGKESNIRRQIQMEDESLRNIKTLIRKLGQKMNTLQRNKQIQMVTNLRNENHKYTKLSKLREIVIQKEKQLQLLAAQHQILAKQDEDNTYVIVVEEENVNLKKNIIVMEKQLHVLEMKIKEINLELEALLKNRYKEINNKQEMQKRLIQEKTTLSNQNSLTVEGIQIWAKQQLLLCLKKTVQNNKKLSTYTTYYSDLLSKVEDNIQELVEKKPQLRGQIVIYGNDVTKLLKEISDEQKRQCTLIGSIVQSEAKCKRYKKFIPGIIDKVAKEQAQIKVLEKECLSLQTQIKIKEKQVELIAILKGLSLQEVQISKSTNLSIQDRLVGFMRNWQNLQRN